MLYCEFIATVISGREAIGHAEIDIWTFSSEIKQESQSVPWEFIRMQLSGRYLTLAQLIIRPLSFPYC